MENNPKEIDTDQEMTVALADRAIKNWKVITLWATMILIVVTALTISFFKFGGLDMLESIFGKQPTVIQTQGKTK